MHLCFVVLLVVATLQATMNTCTASIVDYTANAVRSFTVAPPKRLLRIYDDNNEERAGPLNKLTELIKAGAAKVKEGSSQLVQSAKLEKYLLQNKDGVQVLEKLKLGDDAVEAVQNAKFAVLTKYISMYDKKNSKNPISMIGTLTTRYGDDAVAKALVSGQRRATSPTMMHEMKLLRNDQLDRWMNGGKSIDNVFKLLKLRQDGYDALTSRKLEVLEDYIRLANRQTSQRTSLLDRLTN